MRGWVARVEWMRGWVERVCDEEIKVVLRGLGG